MSNLTDQEVVRRENLQKIEDLGFNPFPAEKVEVNFKTTDYTTPEYQDLLAKKLEELKGVGPVGAANLRDALFANKFRTSEILKNEDLVKEFKLSENASFDTNVKREAQTLDEFFKAVKTEALGAFMPADLIVYWQERLRLK